MESELPDRDVVLIKQSTNNEDGQIYAVEFNNQTYVKKCIFIKPICVLFR